MIVALVLGSVFFGSLTAIVVLIENSRCRACESMLGRVHNAIRSYRARHGTIPPAFVADEEGAPINSWRVLLAGHWWYSDFPKSGYQFEKPWDGPENANNRKRMRNAPDCLVCPSYRYRTNGRTLTSYVAVIGEHTMWTGPEGVRPAEDGSDDDKILLIEVVNSDIFWMEPRDMTLDEALDRISPRNGIGIGSYHWCGIHYVTVDGTVRTLPRNLDRETLRRLLVRGGSK